MISIQTQDFDPAEEYQRLKDSGAGTGAITTFTGLVRDSGDLSGVEGPVPGALPRHDRGSHQGPD